MDLLYLLHQTLCGGLAAAGFGMLFNIGYRALPWCAASGALALSVRTVTLGWGWSLPAASFAAALTVGVIVQLLQSPLGVSRNALAAVGCIPMIPGGVATKAVLGLFAVAAQHPSATNQTLVTAVENTLRVLFTIGALGTGLALPTLQLRARRSK
jgi:uncharacterized membrane protein YjjB (DUF3815 family)